MSIWQNTALHIVGLHEIELLLEHKPFPFYFIYLHFTIVYTPANSLYLRLKGERLDQKDLHESLPHLLPPKVNTFISTSTILLILCQKPHVVMSLF